ncbi:MAG: DUF448 domain-containing protein [Deltaproteobacteria bacterium]|nr:DUF448 domain-containing protein [Deltaproteobacteria bacterium]
MNRQLTGKHRRHVPLRTCIACREKRNKAVLIRMIRDESGRVVRDDAGRGGGRGAYVCPDRSCLEKLKKGHLLRRALRADSPLTLNSEIWTI